MTISEIVDKGHGCVFWNGARSDTGYWIIRKPFRPWASMTHRAPPPQLNKMGIVRNLRVSSLRC